MIGKEKKKLVLQKKTLASLRFQQQGMIQGGEYSVYSCPAKCLDPDTGGGTGNTATFNCPMPATCQAMCSLICGTLFCTNRC